MLREQLQLTGERVGWMRFREEAEEREREDFSQEVRSMRVEKAV